MARRCFFSFHYDRDIWRANVVRNCWMTQDRDEAGFFDASLWEEAKKKGREAIERMIDQALENTAVTAVLIGTETADREYVGYEIQRSVQRGNGLLGIYIHGIQDRLQRTDTKGKNPLEAWQVDRNGQKVLLSNIYRTYDWIGDNGYSNCGSWIEAAAKSAGR